MAHRSYTPECKDEAVRQVVERGYTVKEVAARLGISAASLYAWRRAPVPPKPQEVGRPTSPLPLLPPTLPTQPLRPPTGHPSRVSNVA